MRSVDLIDRQPQLTAGQPALQFIPDSHLACIRDDLALGVGDDRVAALQGAQGAERVQQLGQVGELLAGVLQFQLGSGVQALAQALDVQLQLAQAGQGGVGLQAALQQGQFAAAAAQQVGLGQYQALFQFVQALGLLPQLGARVFQAPLQVAEFEGGVAELAPYQAYQAGFDSLQLLLPLALVGAQQFGGGGGGGGARVGDHVGDTEIHLVAHRRDNRQLTGGDRPGDDFLVEGPQVLEGAAAATDDQCIELNFALPLPAVGPLNGRGDLPGGSLALHGDREQGYLDARAAPAQHCEDVVDGGAGGGGDDPEVGDARRQGFFAGRIEQALGQQAGLEFLERCLQRARAGLFKVFHDQLELAAPLVQGYPAAQADVVAVGRGETQALVAVAEHGAAHLRAAVLQREVPVAGGGHREVAHLPLDPDEVKMALQQHPRLAIELADGEAGGRALCVEGVGQGVFRGNFCLPGLSRGFIIARLPQCRQPEINPMLRIAEEALTFDDVLLLPGYSEVVATQVSLQTRLTRGIELNIPLVSAAMDTVTEYRLAIAMAQEGGIGIIHKSMTIAEQAEQVRRVKKFESGMVKDPITIQQSATVAELIELTSAHGISGVPVLNGPDLVGIVTRRDLRFETNPEKLVSAIMTPRDKLVTVKEGASSEEVQRLLHQHRIEKILVVNDNFDLCGMITVKDFDKAESFPLACKDSYGQLRVGASVGTSPDTDDRVEALVRAGVDVLVVDTAHGHSRNVIERVRMIKADYPSVQVIGGNIATGAAAIALAEAGVDGVKVGIGPGSICTTRIVTGTGVPQITAIANVMAALKSTGIPLIADGGIRFSGDIAKALVAGAHSVMMGSMFAGTEEAPGEVELYQGRTYKAYRGMGSLGAMSRTQGSSDRYFQDASKGAEKLVPEGIEGRVPYKGPVSAIVHQLMGGVRSAMGYTGSADIESMRTLPEFVRVTSAGMSESHVHDVSITKEAPNYPVR